MKAYLSDTTVIVDLLRGKEKAKSFLKNNPLISIVSFAEVIQGARDKNELRTITKACHALHLEEINREISLMAVELVWKYNLSHGLLYLDALIAATCLIRKKMLVSDNVKDFAFISGIDILSQSEAFKK